MKVFIEIISLINKLHDKTFLRILFIIILEDIRMIRVLLIMESMED